MRMRAQEPDRSVWRDWENRPRCLDKELEPYAYAGNHRGFYLFIHYPNGKKEDPDNVLSVGIRAAGDHYWRIDGVKLKEIRQEVDSLLGAGRKRIEEEKISCTTSSSTVV